MNARWRVDNMGMTGWGLDLMIRAIEHHGRKADPDVVVLAVYTDDFRRLVPYYAGVGYAYPKFEFSESELTSVPFPIPGSGNACDWCSGSTRHAGSGSEIDTI